MTVVLPLPVGWLGQPCQLLLGGPKPPHPSSQARFPWPLQEQVSWAGPGQAASSEGWEPRGWLPWVQAPLPLRACGLSAPQIPPRPECGGWSYHLPSAEHSRPLVRLSHSVVCKGWRMPPCHPEVPACLRSPPRGGARVASGRHRGDTPSLGVEAARPTGARKGPASPTRAAPSVGSKPRGDFASPFRSSPDLDPVSPLP